MPSTWEEEESRALAESGSEIDGSSTSANSASRSAKSCPFGFDNQRGSEVRSGEKRQMEEMSEIKIAGQEGDIAASHLVDENEAICFGQTEIAQVAWRRFFRFIERTSDM